MGTEDALARSGRGAAALRGVAATVAGLGAGELLAGLIPPHASPVAAVAGFLVDIAPTWAKELAISWFGTWDKLAIIVGIVVVVLGLGALAGLLQRWRPPAGTVLIIALGLIGLVAVVGRGTSGSLGVLPALLGAVVAVVAFVLLPRAVGRTNEVRVGAATSAAAGAGAASAAPEEMPPVGAADDGVDAERPSGGGVGTSRRTFLAWAGGLTVAGALAAVGGAAMSGLLRARSAVGTALRLPVAAVPLPPVPAAAELGITGLAPVVTPAFDFYRVDTAFVLPSLSPEDWRLRVHGRVDQPFELGWDELVALEFEEFDTTLICVSNPVGGPYVGNARWLGTRLRPLLERAMPQADADMVLSSSIDGWTAGTPIESLLDPDRAAILAVAMNGEPLTPDHGAPVRMVVPGLYGYVSATKWVVDLEVTRFDERSAYWTDRGWSALGPVKLQSRIDVPRSRMTIPPGATPIAGVAWYQHTGIAGVEVQIDGGEWQPTELAEAIGVDTWVQWHTTWDAVPGEHKIRVRATGANGEQQISTAADVVPDGATGYHTITVQVA